MKKPIRKVRKERPKKKDYFPEEPNKIMEFHQFLKLHQLDTEKDAILLAGLNNLKIAKLLGVNKSTITAWRKTKAFKDAKAKGFKKIIKSMTVAGIDDWKMWRKLMEDFGGIDDTQNINFSGNSFQFSKDDASDYAEYLKKKNAERDRNKS